MCLISTDENTLWVKQLCKYNKSYVAIFLPKEEQAGEMALFQFILLLLKNLPC